MNSPDDLRCLPLMHGSLFLYKHWEDVKSDGLIAGSGKVKGGVNTFSLDVAFGRNQYVFLGTACSSGDYGNGDCVIVHPDVYGDKECLCFLNDPGSAGGVFDQLRRCWQFGRSRFSTFLESVADEQLASIVVEIESEIAAELDDDEWAVELKRRVCESTRTQDYYQQQIVSVETLLNEIWRECARRGFRLRDYISRKFCEWPLTEEVLVHGRIEPEFILGRIRKREWIPCEAARSFSHLPSFLELMNVAA